MYARLENNKIKTYNAIPSKFQGITGNYAGGFHKMPTDTHRQEGFKMLIKPILGNGVLNTYGEIIERDDTFEYSIVPRYPNLTLEQAKIDKIKSIKAKTNTLLSMTDWVAVRLYETGKAIPENISEERSAIRLESDNAEIEIESMITISEILNYKYL